MTSRMAEIATMKTGRRHGEMLAIPFRLADRGFELHMNVRS